GAEKSAPATADFLLADSVDGLHVLDIGGGPLTYGTAFAARGAKVTVQDLPPVVELMKEKAKKAGITLFPGDFNIELPSGPFDLAFLGNICHIFGEEENQELFRKVSQVLITGGRIAIIDMIRDSNKNILAAVFGVNMLVSTRKGGSWTLEQYTGWLVNAGFKNVKLDELAHRQVITAVKG
ncbi:MAG: class I SAM-dependent methyltransferase, partial [Bacillota bacterium]